MATQLELVAAIDDRLMDLEDALAEAEYQIHQSRSALENLRAQVERLADLADEEASA